jgi:hypothetical protein
MCLKLQSLTFRLPSLRQSRRPALENMMEKLDFKEELAELYNPQEQRLGSSRCARHELPEHDVAFNGRQHQIYLSDPRKTVPAKLKTILRQPVRHL